MRLFSLILLSTVLTACASTKPAGIMAEKCGPTPIKLKDTEVFGFTPVKNKIVVMRVFATWCPYCKEDLATIGAKFKSGEWKTADVQIYLMSYKNRRENRETYTEFIRDTFPKFGIPSSAAQIVYVDKDYPQLAKMKSQTKKLMFEGWQGVPFGLVFGKDGRLAFRGHFTQGPSLLDAHYAFITQLTKETCK